MKTLRFIGMALFAILMCVNFAACSSDDDPTEEPEEGGVVVSGKKITNMVEQGNGCKYIYTFSYDDKNRLVKATLIEEENNYKYTDSYQFI